MAYDNAPPAPAAEENVEIIEREIVFKKAIFKIEQARLRHRRYDGSMSKPIMRLNLERGDSVAMLLHDRAAGTVVLTEQFRYPTYAKGPGWLLELPAGMVEDDEDPIKTAYREIVEETGYTPDAASLQHVSTFYLSPGGTSERIVLYYVAVTPQDRTESGGGLDDEDEDIRIVVMSLDNALAGIADGTIQDAKTIIGLQWLQARQAVG